MHCQQRLRYVSVTEQRPDAEQPWRDPAGPDPLPRRDSSAPEAGGSLFDRPPVAESPEPLEEAPAWLVIMALPAEEAPVKEAMPLSGERTAP